MITAHSVEQAVLRLPQEEFIKFRDWFLRFESDAWDKQIEGDAAFGKLDALAEEALAEYQSGSFTEP